MKQVKEFTFVVPIWSYRFLIDHRTDTLGPEDVDFIMDWYFQMADVFGGGRFIPNDCTEVYLCEHNALHGELDFVKRVTYVAEFYNSTQS